MNTALDALRQAQFSMTDVIRRAQGDAVGALGLNPSESPYRTIDFGTHWRLRDYGGEDDSRSLLIIAAPIKRPYIWDLAPSVSAIRYCLQQALHVHLLEWMPASPGSPNNGLDEYASAIVDCMATISRKTSPRKCFLIGHSLGGTLAAIFSAWAPASVRGLGLLVTGSKVDTKSAPLAARGSLRHSHAAGAAYTSLRVASDRSLQKPKNQMD